jgi:hypothetical protein
MNKKQEKFYAKKAVRRGKTYCAPWCGRGCTVAEFDLATAKAKALVDKLNAIGGKWKPYVWENLGWHYEAKSAYETSTKRFHVTEHSDGSYTVWWANTTSSAKTLHRALIEARAQAQVDLVDAQQNADMIRKVIGNS